MPGLCCFIRVTQECSTKVHVAASDTQVVWRTFWLVVGIFGSVVRLPSLTVPVLCSFLRVTLEMCMWLPVP